MAYMVRSTRAIFFGNKVTFARLCVSGYFHKEGSVAESSQCDPLYGIRVLDLTRIVAGPFCTMVLGDLGAEIIKVEQPGTGDESRKWGPPFKGTPPESCYFLSLNRNKKSVCVDFKSSKGKEVMYELAKKCDVLVENYVPGKLDKMGLGYEALKEVAPHLIYCSITGFGPEGPYKNRPGYDVIAASIGGLLHITGPKDGEPCKPGVALTDLMTGLYAHGSIMAALLKRARAGVGQKIDCNLLSTQVSSLINIGANYLMAGNEAKRHGTAHPSIVPYQTFQTADEHYLTIGTGSDAQFTSLCIKVGLPDLPKDEKYSTNIERVKNRTALIDILKAAFRTKTKQEWVDILGDAAFPNGPVNTLSEQEPTRTVRLKLRKPKSKKKVQWEAETVDNEHLNRKKSKCCCVYRKPKAYDESSSDTDDQCEHCSGHVEVKKANQQKKEEPQPGGSATCTTDTCQRRAISESKTDIALLPTQPVRRSIKKGSTESTRRKNANAGSWRPRRRVLSRTARLAANRTRSPLDSCPVASISCLPTVRRRTLCDRCQIVRHGGCSVPVFLRIATEDKDVQTDLLVPVAGTGDKGTATEDECNSESWSVVCNDDKETSCRKIGRRRCVCL